SFVSLGLWRVNDIKSKIIDVMCPLFSGLLRDAESAVFVWPGRTPKPCLAPCRIREETRPALLQDSTDRSAAHRRLRAFAAMRIRRRPDLRESAYRPP